MPNFLNKKRIVHLGVWILALAIVGAGAFYVGLRQGEKNPQSIVIKGVSDLEPEQQISTDFSLFWEAWQKLKDNHVKGAEIKDQDFLYGAIAGITGALKDPNTVFFPPEDSKKFEEDVVGNFGGIGAEIGVRNEQLIVVAPIEGSPAEQAGLRAGDKILAINNDAASKMDVNEAVKKIRGEIGTKVTLTILRNGETKPREITIVRGKIEVPTLKLNVLNDNIVQVQLFSFNQNAPFLFYRAALTALLGNASGMVLDLRNNPGGFLEIAVNLAGWFLDRGDVVTIEKFRSGDENVFRANGNGALQKMPLVILINRGSASASEILAGALRDHNGTKLIGEKSFGKGTVQELFELKDSSKLKITVASWLLPKGGTIEEDGLVPDVEVKITEEDINAEKDPQLEKAVEILKEEIKNQ